jgi:hypothetical protein
MSKSNFGRELHNFNVLNLKKNYILLVHNKLEGTIKKQL